MILINARGEPPPYEGDNTHRFVAVTKKITIIQGHPDPDPARFGRALAEHYRRSARQAGHDVRTIDVATIDFPWLRTKDDFENASAPPAILRAQQDIARADHVVLIYPLWLGDVPALLKAFFEQVFRPGFAFKADGPGLPRKLLKGKSARIVVTMGMPAFFYRWYFGAHGLKNLKRNILRFSGFAPIAQDIIGMIEGKSGASRDSWLRRMENYGRRGV
ncbi:MAG: NAD(P)H-dependent oxidoreductase [Rhodospirillaceae bacterium]|nr:NAD(P)H-dependent oxidoreductase [Rhodospirillaceae bacterium]